MVSLDSSCSSREGRARGEHPARRVGRSCAQPRAAGVRPLLPAAARPPVPLPGRPRAAGLRGGVLKRLGGAAGRMPGDRKFGREPTPDSPGPGRMPSFRASFQPRLPRSSCGSEQGGAGGARGRVRPCRPASTGCFGRCRSASTHQKCCRANTATAGHRGAAERTPEVLPAAMAGWGRDGQLGGVMWGSSRAPACPGRAQEAGGGWRRGAGRCREAAGRALAGLPVLPLGMAHLRGVDRGRDRPGGASSVDSPQHAKQVSMRGAAGRPPCTLL